MTTPGTQLPATLLLVLGSILLSTFSPQTEAAIISVMIGDDDGFAGITGTSPGAPAGTAINVSSLTASPAFFTAPTAIDETDRRSANALLTLNYSQAIDLTSLSSLSSASVQIRMASAGLV